MHDLVRRIWGGASAFLERTRRGVWVDVVVVAALAGLLVGLTSLGREWTGHLRPEVAIDLRPAALPRYAFYSLIRGLLAYALSLLFTLVYGYWAAKDRRAGRVLVPLLDILQSIPVLGFMPGLVLVLVGLFPRSNVGLELAAVLMIFTGQAWNMTFSFYHSLRTVPTELQEAGTVYGFGWWQRFRWVELPFATMGLVWNSMMSMAGGWFFLMISEAFVLGERDYRLPGLGSFMSVALARGDARAMAWAVAAMAVMIVLLDQLLWRPVVVWAQKYRIEEGGGDCGPQMSSWLLDRLRRSYLLGWVRERLSAAAPGAAPAPAPPAPSASPPRAAAAAAGTRQVLALAVFAALVAGLGLGAWKLVHLLAALPLRSWSGVFADTGRTLGRVLLATAVATLWTVPAGIAVGLSPRLSRIVQPVVQLVASFPAPMLFPAAIAALAALGVPLGWGSIVLMLLGTQWYILFNVIAGAMAVPADLREAARSYRLGAVRRFFAVYLPAVFPYLVTGWVTAAGGAWNASIVAEYVTFRGQVLTAPGIGARISAAAESASFPLLAASVTVMAVTVVLFNRLVWRRCYDLAASRFSLAR